jgi:hypothetical protein
MSEPGLDLQLQAAAAYGVFYPDRVRNMEPEYDRFYRQATSSYVRVLPRIDLALLTMRSLAVRHGAAAGLLAILGEAQRLEAVRPAGWMAQEVATLAAFVGELPSSGLPFRTRLLLEMRAEGITAALT